MPTASLHEMPLWLRFRKAGARPSDFIEYFDVKAAPVPVFEIARGLGAKLYRQRNISEDGRVEFEESSPYPQPVIFTNAEHHINRRRFTVAHELGHLMMHDLVTQLRDTRHQRPDIQEVQANSFAAQLLMPRSIINRYVMAGITDVEQLAKRFRVSPAAMSIRLRAL